MRADYPSHREIAIVDDKGVLANDGFLKRSVGFLPRLLPWEMEKTFLQLLDFENFMFC